MSNMSYCRFQNTALDLYDCVDFLRSDDPEEMSIEEQKAFARIIKLAKEIAENYSDWSIAK